MKYLFAPGKNIPAHSNARIQRWANFLSGFNFNINHITGNNNFVADALSRVPIEESEMFNIPGEFVNLLSCINETSIDLDKIKEYTSKDRELID